MRKFVRQTSLALGLLVSLAFLASAPGAAAQAGGAEFGAEPASSTVRGMADWVTVSGDNHGLPFVIIDKMEAKVFVFHGDGRLRGAAPALLGVALGDESVPGIGERKLAQILPEERTTPAGRFVAGLGANLSGQDILWVDYDAAISLHRVVTTKPEERRAQRLATASSLDNRISYGCINVPVEFYEAVVQAAFTGTVGIVYVIPETRPLRDVFPAYEDAQQATDAPPPPASPGIAG